MTTTSLPTTEWDALPATQQPEWRDHPAYDRIREKLADAHYRSNDLRSAMHVYQFLLKSIQSRSKDDAPNVELARVMKKIGKVLAKRGEQDSAMSYFQNALGIYEKLGAANRGEAAATAHRLHLTDL